MELLQPFRLEKHIKWSVTPFHVKAIEQCLQACYFVAYPLCILNNRKVTCDLYWWNVPTILSNLASAHFSILLEYFLVLP